MTALAHIGACRSFPPQLFCRANTLTTTLATRNGVSSLKRKRAAIPMITPQAFSSHHKTSKNLSPYSDETGGTVVIVDDSDEWRACVREILDVQPELQIVGEARDGFEAVHRTAELRPDLVVLDIGMPVMNGLEAAGLIRRLSPHSKIVFLTQENNPHIRSAALAAGAHGYVLKTGARTELLTTIAAVLGDDDSNSNPPHR